MRWVKDPTAEHGLRTLGIKFETATVKLSDIDRKLSADHQVRLGEKINDDYVVDYALAMQNGADFPMPILNKLKRGYFIWSGNHRVGAAELSGQETIDAYIVEVNDLRLQDILCRVVGVWSTSIPYERTERIIQAAYLVSEHSMDVATASKMLMVKVEALYEHIKRMKVAAAIAQAGVTVNGVSKSLLSALAPIQDQTVTARVVKLIKKAGVKGSEAAQLVDDVKRQTTTAAMLKEVERWDDMYKARSHREKQPPKGGVKPPHEEKVGKLLLNILQRLEKLVRGKCSRENLQLVEQTKFVAASDYWRHTAKILDPILKGGA
jgi:hypothetical protein